MKNKKGFTLIELLMTILIIGILSAVAFPQYTKALERSRATEAMSMVKAINDSIYAFSAGRSDASCPETFRKLSITLPTENDTTDSISLKNFRYDLKGATNALVPGTDCPGATATRIHGGIYDYVIWNPYRVRTSETEHSRLGCYSPSGNLRSSELCQSLGLQTQDRPTVSGGGQGMPINPHLVVDMAEQADLL